MKSNFGMAAVLGLSILLVGGTAVAETVPDTGQVRCYNNEEQIPCPQPGEPFFGQDGNYDTNPQSFTKLDSNGNDLPENASDWVMVRDNVTGLIWEVKHMKDGQKNYDDPRDADNTYTWYDPNPQTNGGDEGRPGDGTDTQDFIHALNQTRLGGFSNWRLPTIRELLSIVDRENHHPSINRSFFIYSYNNICVTSTTLISSNDFVRYVSFANGETQSRNFWNSKSRSWHVRAVRKPN